jgi:hypothetical protein
VWNPNVPYWGSTPLSALYPGAAFVDAVALDGYNWGTSASWSTWVSPSQLFGQGLAELRGLAPGKQILIGETSSAEQGGSKAEWASSLVGYLTAQGDVTALTWFHFDKETDCGSTAAQPRRTRCAAPCPPAGARARAPASANPPLQTPARSSGDKSR